MIEKGEQYDNSVPGIPFQRGNFIILYARLKMYEDSCLLPDDLTYMDELCQNKQLWILPVRPGDSSPVYFIEDPDVGVESDHVVGYTIGPNCAGDIVCLAEGSLGMMVNIEELHLSEFAARATLLVKKEQANGE